MTHYTNFPVFLRIGASLQGEVERKEVRYRTVPVPHDLAADTPRHYVLILVSMMTSNFSNLGSCHS